MLSKSQARTFFIGFTVLFSGVFLGLTVDTIAQVPARSHEENMSADVIAGKTLWDTNNCMGCHTLLGEGAYYAPELTKVVDRRGATWIKLFLEDPEAMYPGRRKMVKYDFTDAERDQIIAFLDWVGKIDTNGFPRDPDMVPKSSAQTTTGQPATGQSTAAATVSPHAAAPPMFTQVCQACHAVGGSGGAVGPALDGVAGRFDAAQLDTWLRDPQAVKPGTAMPNLNLPDSTRAELVTWLMTLN